MKRWLRRIRGAMRMGLAWALAWFGAGLVLLLIVGVDAADVPFPIGFGVFGFFAGVTFSGVLAVVDVELERLDTVSFGAQVHGDRNSPEPLRNAVTVPSLVALNSGPVALANGHPDVCRLAYPGYS